MGCDYIMRKSICFLLIFCILSSLSLVGCNSDPVDENTPPSSESTPSNTESTPPDSETVQPNESPVSDFEYTVNNDGGITINKYIGKAVDVVIPEKIDGKNTTAIARNAFFRNDEIVTVIMPDTVTTIEYTAFEHCSSLVKVSLSQNLSSIENAVFKACKNL